MSVRAKSLSFLLKDLPIEYRYLNQSTEHNPSIKEMTLDLDEVRTGVLFVARRLWYRDTHEQLTEVINKGAAAILVSRSEIDDQVLNADLPIIWVEQEDPTLGLICDRFYESPTAKLKVYGVTGTNGKTSAVSYLADFLRAIGERVAVMGTVEYRFENRVLTAANTTPDALVIQRFARQALDLGATSLALEVSSHALSLDRVAGVQFNAVGFTSFSRDHLDFHGSLEAYRAAKGRLFKDYLQYALKAGKQPIAVAHDDEDGLEMLQRVPIGVQTVRCRVGEGYSSSSLQTKVTMVENTTSDGLLLLKNKANPTLKGIEISAEFSLDLDTTHLPTVTAPLIGDYHPANCAIALAMLAMQQPRTLQKAWSSLTESRGVPGRMERVNLPCLDESDERVALVDYAHTPAAITRALQAIKAVHSGYVSVIIGCGGNRDRGKRPKMLEAALQGADRVWLTSDNPRDEVPLQIIQDALGDDQNEGSRSCEVIVDRRECIAQAWQELPQVGALLVTGKGHESYQEIKGKKYRFQDYEVVKTVAWAEVHQIDQLDVPLYVGFVDQPNESTDLQHYMLRIFREAALRVGGLSIRVSSTESRQTHNTLMISYQSRSEVGLSEVLAKYCLYLTAQHREIYIHVDQSDISEISEQLRQMVKMINNIAYPHPYIPILIEQEIRPSTLGGWSSLEAGPKIPSLI